MPLAFKSSSEEQTAAFAAAFAHLMKPGDIVLLKGELGAGKTFFVRAAAHALGVSEPVTSPSFTMANTYRGETMIHHLDLYRLAAFDAQAHADFSSFFSADAITFIEWPEAAESYINEPTVTITMEHAGDDSRRLVIETASEELGRELEVLVDAARH